jgi:hypothetical protein
MSSSINKIIQLKNGQVIISAGNILFKISGDFIVPILNIEYDVHCLIQLRNGKLVTGGKVMSIWN